MSKPKKVTLKDGSVRWRIVTDAGRDPVTGKRKQLTRTFGRRRTRSPSWPACITTGTRAPMWRRAR